MYTKFRTPLPGTSTRLNFRVLTPLTYNTLQCNRPPTFTTLAGPQHTRSSASWSHGLSGVLARVGVILQVHCRHVILHATRVVGPVPAQTARVRLLLVVDADVPNQVGLLRECLVAHAADEGPLSRVGSLVLDDLGCAFAGVRAVPALPAAHRLVRQSPVLLQEGRGGEERGAVLAGEGLQ
ncbi:unnamed protein product [Ixodes pacificus]